MKMKKEPPKGEPIDDDALESFRSLLSSKGNLKERDFDRADGSDDEINAQSHRKLLTAIEKIDRTQHIKAPSRTEVATKESEFHVIKSHGLMKPQERFTFHQLPNVSKKSSATVIKDLKKLSKSKKKLAKPLEKPVIERISRGIAYEKARYQLDRWEAVVQKNRFDDCLVFPQKPSDEIIIEEDATDKTPSYRIKSDLMLELEALDAKRAEQVGGEEVSPKEDEKLSKKELLAQQKELARLRRKESYEIEKARRQKKIKSKKYHKVLKKDRIRKQLLEFEKLQKSDPEEALRRLELIEKNRVAERSHLRHRNTGTWAKSLQVRAKFDKDARKDLAEQLAIGRELKEQKNSMESEESDQEAAEDAEKDEDYDPFNPWQTVSKKSTDEILGTYRKYWQERNHNEQKRKEYEALEIPEVSTEQEKHPPEEIPKKKKKVGGLAWTIEDIDEDDIKLSTICVPPDDFEGFDRKKKPLPKKKVSIDAVFDSAEQKLEQKLAQKLTKFQKTATKGKKASRKTSKKVTEKSHLNLELKKTAQRPEIDEALQESSKRANPDDSQDFNQLKKIASGDQKDSEIANIAPDSFATVEVKSLRTAIPDDVQDEDEDSERINGKLSLTEAFEDDDIFRDFSREKEDQIAADQPQDLDLTLPGWGSWTGQGVKKQPKRMILKFPKNLPRKDSKKDSVIINEILSGKTKEHLVRDLPFPFTSVKDYEASIRAPVGRTFVPETAHRVLTKPSLVTKMGTIIEPMDEKMLLSGDKPQRIRTKTGKKIQEINEKMKIHR
ncbi:U3 small nucleolar RNA-associated protein 14 homolog A [Phlebotomus papatasi]|uniref:Uncharacterized protein n=1 Tax=Phlebotomus papatasi TaxID=29031 RepID=A0A1B0CZ30_PHLPP|nr:U3 small nucleolar RNA-associated protein 14 homolog A [Phlebotomus papatasi]